MKNILKLTIEVEYSLYQNFELPYWKFIIGMPLNQAIDIISNQSGDHFKKVDFLYSFKVPMHMDIIITLFNEGIKLIFDPRSQRLKIIEIYDLTLVSLYYCKEKFNSVPDLPTKEQIISVFGWTKTPEYHHHSKCYQLSYRNWLSFYLSNVNQDVCANQQYIYSSTNLNHLVATSCYIYDGNSVSEAQIPKEIPLECFLGNVLLEELVINRKDYRTQTFDFHLSFVENVTNTAGSSLPVMSTSPDDKIVKIKRSITFGDSVQYVITALGAPNRIYFKTEDKMKIHSPKSQKEKLERKMSTRNSDYFYNYFTLGVDIMFRFEDNCVSKLILHTNFPDEYLFNTYYRCNFSMNIDRDSSSVDSLMFPNIIDNEMSTFNISTVTKWTEVQQVVMKRADHVPVEISRFIDQCHKTGVCSETMAYGVDDLIFEIMPENDHIASLTIYEINDNMLES